MAKKPPRKNQLTDEDVKQGIKLALRGAESGDYTSFNNWLTERAIEYKLNSAQQMWKVISGEIDRRRLAN